MRLKERHDSLSRYSSEELLYELAIREDTTPAAIKTERYTPHVRFSIGIGDNEIADIVMTQEAMEDLVERNGIQ